MNFSYNSSGMFWSLLVLPWLVPIFLAGFDTLAFLTESGAMDLAVCVLISAPMIIACNLVFFWKDRTVRIYKYGNALAVLRNRFSRSPRVKHRLSDFDRIEIRDDHFRHRSIAVEHYAVWFAGRTEFKLDSFAYLGNAKKAAAMVAGATSLPIEDLVGTAGASPPAQDV